MEGTIVIVAGVLIGTIAYWGSKIAGALNNIAAKLEQRRVERQPGQSCDTCGVSGEGCSGIDPANWCQEWHGEQGQ